jgi:hypothetical protein
VTEIPYANVTSIEHTRRYPWKTLIEGFAVSLLFFIGIFATSILPQPLASMVTELLDALSRSGIMQQTFLNIILIFATLAPFLAAATVFAVEARTGFTLRGPGKETIYLPSQFREVITFIRNMQDLDFERGPDSKKRKLPIAMDQFLDEMET